MQAAFCDKGIAFYEKGATKKKHLPILSMSPIKTFFRRLTPPTTRRH